MLNEDYIFLDVKVTNKNQLLGFIADKAHEYNICDNREGLLEDLIKREAEFPTGLQDGFAIPHACSGDHRRWYWPSEPGCGSHGNGRGRGDGIHGHRFRRQYSADGTRVHLFLFNW